MPNSLATPLPADLFGDGGAQAGPGLWETFRRHKWLILLLTVVGGGLGYLAFMKQEPVYVSTARVRVERDAMPGTDEVDDAGDLGVGTRVQEVISQRVLLDAITAKNLAQRPEFADEKSAFGAIVDRLEVERLPDSDILELSYFGETEEEPQVVLSAVTDAYQKFLTAGFGSRVGTMLEYINQARGELDTELADLRETYREMREKSPLVRGENGMVSPHEAEMQRYGQERDALQVKIERNRARIDAIRTARERTGNDAALALLVEDFQNEDGTTRPSKELQIRDELFPLQQQEQELITRYGPRHPEVTAIRSRIKALETFLAEQLGDDDVPKSAAELLDLYVKKLELELETVGAEALALNERFEKERAAAAEDGNEELKLNTLGKRIEQKEAIFATINTKLNELNITPDDVKGFSVRMLAQPGPGSVSEAAMPLFAGAGAAAGFLLGFGIAFLLTALDRRFATVSDLREVTGAPVLAHTPVISPKVKRMKRDGATLEGADEFVTAAASPTLLAVHSRLDARGRYVEACRRIRAGLFFSSRGGDLKVVQVTSPSPEDGKSTTAANMAVVIADSGRRTLLLDCDFRRPTQHALFGIDGDAPGAVDVLTGEAELEDCLRDVGVDGLHVLPCGSKPGNASELLDSDHFADFLSVLREKFDFIIVDSPPVLAVSDPLTIAPRTDGVVMVMRLDGKTRDRVRSVVNQLERVGANVLGTVVTGVAAASTEDGAYKYDSYGGYAYACGAPEADQEKKYDRYRAPGPEADRKRVKRPRATFRGGPGSAGSHAPDRVNGEAADALREPVAAG